MGFGEDVNCWVVELLIVRIVIEKFMRGDDLLLVFIFDGYVVLLRNW